MTTQPIQNTIEAEGFLSIPVHTLRVDMVTSFSLWIAPRPGAAPVLYRGENLPFTEEIRERLESHGVTRLYVSNAEKELVRHYIERNMEALLSDPEVPVEERSELMYESAQHLVREAMEDPRSGKLVERSSEMVPHMVSFIYNQKRSFQCLLRVCSHDYYTYTHSVNVFTYCVALAQHLGCPEEEVKRFGLGALLHDVGKSSLPLDVINSPGQLSDEQWQLMRMHPVHGYDILVEQGMKDPIVLDVTRHHHEKLNGKGYPDRLAGDQISSWARICTIVDIFDALTTRRSYKEARLSFESLQFMRAHMADEIDLNLFRGFVALMGQQEKG
jgi:putative nucleotidyltransferase with HDIG domain